jgi:hypothetical protein
MYNPDTDLLFPSRTLPALRDLRGTPWRELITNVMETGPDSFELMAFILMMARMNNCTSCNADSYRAMNGCTACSKQSIKRCRETDEVLMGVYQAARTEIEQYLNKKASLHQGIS